MYFDFAQYKQRGFSTLIILLSLLLLGGLIGGAFYLGKINFNKQPVINNFEDCAKAGYPVMESYPAQCRTSDGRIFTQELSEEEKSKLVPPISDETDNLDSIGANWNTYTSNKLQISFKYPEDWSLNDIHLVEDLQIIDFYYSKLPKGSLPPFTLNIYANPQNLSLKEFNKNRVVRNCQVYYPNSKEVNIADGRTAYLIEKGFCEPLEAKMYIWTHNNYIFQFRSKNYQKIENQDKVFDQILATFKFIQ